MDLATGISIASAVAAILSALYAASSARSARRSADLAENDLAERTKGVQAYLVDGVQWKQADKKEVVAISCTITNLSSLPNTIVRTELILHEYEDTGEPSRIMLAPAKIDDLPGQVLQHFEVPINLAPRTTVSGWLCFEIPTIFAKERTIDKYELAFIDSNGRRTSIETYLMHRIVYAKG
jgi:hypothetical protein